MNETQTRREAPEMSIDADAAGPEPTEIIVCETCGGGDRDPLGRTPGEQLHALLHEHLETRGEQQDRAPIRLQTVRCLWACKRSCNVHVRAAYKFGYVLGDFEPTRETAEALLEYAELYARSKDGSVPFRTWPDGVRGHFQCRIPSIEITPAR